MNATYTLHPVYAEVEAVAARAKELGVVAKTAAMIVGAPLIGLAFVIALPIGGLAALAWFAVKALVRHAAIVKRIALFAAAPAVALAYTIAFPFVGLGVLVYYGARAAVN